MNFQWLIVYATRREIQLRYASSLYLQHTISPCKLSMLRPNSISRSLSLTYLPLNFCKAWMTDFVSINLETHWGFPAECSFPQIPLWLLVNLKDSA